MNFEVKSELFYSLLSFLLKILIIINNNKMIIKNYSKHYFPQICFSFLVFHLLTNIHCCNDIIQVRKCLFYVQPLQLSTCTNFQFRNCSYKTFSNGSLQWQTKSHWKQCLHICCGLPQANKQYKIRQKCEESLIASEISSIFLMAGAFTIGVFLICTIYGFIKYKICEKDRRRNETQINHNQVPLSAERLERKDPSRFMKFQEVDCAICFDTLRVGNQLIQLMCGHQFHTQCLLQWVNKKPICPICNDSVFQIRLYCTNCMNLLQKYELKQVKRKGIFPIICQKCNKK